jgi:hypothetical protein
LKRRKEKMSFMAMFPGLVYGHLEENTMEEIESSSKVRRVIFERLTVGVNIDNTDVYQRLAEWLLKVKEEKLKKLTVEDVIKGFGEYRDLSGHLV